jgi:hypothetical protein
MSYYIISYQILTYYTRYHITLYQVGERPFDGLRHAGQVGRQASAPRVRRAEADFRQRMCQEFEALLLIARLHLGGCLNPPRASAPFDYPFFRVG